MNKASKKPGAALVLSLGAASIAVACGSSKEAGFTPGEDAGTSDSAASDGRAATDGSVLDSPNLFEASGDVESSDGSADVRAEGSSSDGATDARPSDASGEGSVLGCATVQCVAATDCGASCKLDGPTKYCRSFNNGAYAWVILAFCGAGADAGDLVEQVGTTFKCGGDSTWPSGAGVCCSDDTWKTSC